MPILVDNASVINSGGEAVSISGVTAPMSGAHDFGIRCRQDSGDIMFNNVQVSAVALSPN